MMTQSNRAGVYIQQPSGYNAFIPSPLPPNPPIQLEGELQTILSEADQALGRLDGSITIIPNPDLFVAMYVRKEAVLSSQIEGTQSSLQNLLEAEAEILSETAPKDVAEVINYVKAMNYGLERLNELPLSVRLIREIHSILLQNVRGRHASPGELRQSQNWIGPEGCTLREAVFVPPPPFYVPQALSDWEKFLHAQIDIPLLIKIGLAHAQFETIHPFLDGNGRLGRLLITFILTEQEMLKKPVLYISYYFKQHKQKYYELLQNIRDTGDWESWLSFFLRGITVVSNEAATTARNILNLRENHRAMITQHLGRMAANAFKVLDYLYIRPIITINDIKEIIKTSYPAANELINRLVNIGIIQEITGFKRNKRYSYTSYIALFS
ncbi:MAG TPA: Fic family protein [Bacteroidales bacterium]|jgi:Fic family protein|nr:Fic family protein [Bacteroidales bacterium]OQC59519.1 MAG: Adenosine monophosphate-protein transferase SoFic [Bacteroidetes bacterium ADurb.Bin012]MBP9512112.1 Fic family protein [Bacteroidales bacterium]MBP9588649.1 Fic family protein [Bacteroidales bacterium]HNQ60273.1 Fic family protein [Bacteroidales bacterium]